jgi:hypothetical protein
VCRESSPSGWRRTPASARCDTRSCTRQTGLEIRNGCTDRAASSLERRQRDARTWSPGHRRAALRPAVSPPGDGRPEDRRSATCGVRNTDRAASSDCTSRWIRGPWASGWRLASDTACRRRSLRHPARRPPWPSARVRPVPGLSDVACSPAAWGAPMEWRCCSPTHLRNWVCRRRYAAVNTTKRKPDEMAAAQRASMEQAAQALNKVARRRRS